ncbi:hypothetical protein T439DRAFT_326712 [Meredithblackwellia eburnea MCA 4105]
MKTGSVGLGLALVASVAASRFGPRAYRQLTLPLKAFGVTSVTTAAFIVGADSASRQYELAKYAYGSGTTLETESRRGLDLEKQAGIFTSAGSSSARLPPRNAGTSVGTTEAVVEWAKEHRYQTVLAGWAASMVGSFAYIAATPLSFAQKLVQARMVAQGLTVAVLIASAGLSSIPTSSSTGHEEELKQLDREAAMYKWKANSPHAKHAAEVVKEQQQE